MLYAAPRVSWLCQCPRWQIAEDRTVPCKLTKPFNSKPLIGAKKESTNTQHNCIWWTCKRKRKRESSRNSAHSRNKCLWDAIHPSLASRRATKTCSSHPKCAPVPWRLSQPQNYPLPMPFFCDEPTNLGFRNLNSETLDRESDFRFCQGHKNWRHSGRFRGSGALELWWLWYLSNVHTSI